MAASRPVAAEPGGNHARYPAQLHEFRRLGDGTDLVLRPLRPEDDALELAFVRGLSRDSRYNRLLSARKLTRAEIRRLTRIDYEREMALVAVAGSGKSAQLLGVARYVKDADAGGAEFAVVVADAWQHKGVGTLLLDALLQHARRAGIARLHGITLATNQPMQGLARKLGFLQSHDPQDATVRQAAKALNAEVLPKAVNASAGNSGFAAANDDAIAGRIPRFSKQAAGDAIQQTP